MFRLIRILASLVSMLVLCSLNFNTAQAGPLQRIRDRAHTSYESTTCSTSYTAHAGRLAPHPFGFTAGTCATGSCAAPGFIPQLSAPTVMVPPLASVPPVPLATPPVTYTDAGGNVWQLVKPAGTLTPKEPVTKK